MHAKCSSHSARRQSHPVAVLCILFTSRALYNLLGGCSCVVHQLTFWLYSLWQPHSPWLDKADCSLYADAATNAKAQAASAASEQLSRQHTVRLSTFHVMF